MSTQPEPVFTPPPIAPARPWPLRQYVLAGVAVAALILAMFLPQVWRGRSLGEGEAITFYLPMRVMVADAWRHGHWPAWNPYVYGGMPLLADCQAGAFYPPNLLYLVLPPLAAMNTILLAEKILAAWGMILLLRAYRVSPLGAFVGAGVFTFSGFMVAHMGHVSIINAAAWIPWICLATHYWCTTNRRGWLVAGAVLWAIQFFAGHPQIVVYTAIIAAMIVVSLRTAGRCRLGPSLLGLAIMSGVAIALCGVQILPTLAMSAETGRSMQPDLGLFQNYRLPIIHTPLLWLPFIFGTQADTPLGYYWWGAWNFVEQAGYVGLMPWLLIPAAAFLPAGRARLGRSWAAIALLHVVLAWNIDTPVGRLLFHVPVYNAFESAGRHLVGLALGLAMVTGIGLDAIGESAPELARRWCRRGSLILIAIMVIFLVGGIAGYEFALAHLRLGLEMIPKPPSFRLRPWAQAPWAFAGPLIFVGLSAWTLLRFAKQPSRMRVVPVLLVLAADIGSAAYLCAWRWRHESTYTPQPPTAELARLLSAPADSSAPPPRYVIFGDWGLDYAVNPHGNMLYGLASLNGYGPFQLRRYREMMGGMLQNGQVHDATWLETSRALDLWACHYVLINKRTGQESPAVLQDPARYRLAYAQGSLRVYENLRAQPHAWLVQEASEFANGPAMRNAITTGSLGTGQPIDPSRQALLESASDRQLLASGLVEPSTPFNAAPRWLSYGPQGLTLETRSDRPAVLILAEPYLEGWSAQLDNQPTTMARADYLLKALAVPPGTHRIELHYRPKGLTRGLLVSAMGGVGLILLTTWPRVLRLVQLLSKPAGLRPSQGPDSGISAT